MIFSLNTQIQRRKEENKIDYYYSINAAPKPHKLTTYLTTLLTTFEIKLNNFYRIMMNIDKQRDCSEIRMNTNEKGCS